MSLPTSPPTLALTRHRAATVAALRAAGCVFAEDEADLLIGSATSSAELLAMAERRADGHPLEHILGWARFCGRRVDIAPGVFVPRARTELLVRLAVALVGRSEAGAAAEAAVAVDLCCGSGAVGAALAAAVPPGRVQLFAADIDPVAVACARRNLAPWGAPAFEGDLFAALPEHLRGRVDVLVANAPYVPTDAIGLLPREARVHEPRRALDGGGDGLDVLRRIAAEAAAWLAPAGHLLVETSHRQAPAGAEILCRAGFTARVVVDESLAATAVTARR